MGRAKRKGVGENVQNLQIHIGHEPSLIQAFALHRYIKQYPIKTHCRQASPDVMALLVKGCEF